MRFLYILVTLLIIGILVTIHELGHFVVGRLCGIGVVEFSIGFGPKIFGFKRKGILYSLRALPLGGFCKFVGEDEENPAPNAMNKQAVWKRILTVAAGPVMNIVFAFVMCVVLLANYAYLGILPGIDSVVDDSPAQISGIMAGDIITAINGEAITFDDAGAMRAREIIGQCTEGQSITLTIQRGDETVDLTLTPEFVTESDTEPRPQIGIMFESVGYTFGQAVRSAGAYMLEFTKVMLESLKDFVFHGKNDISGPVGIITEVSKYVGQGMYMVVNLLFVLSLNLGILNLLPIPALDGGRLVFLIIEAIRRKPIPPEKEGIAHLAGFALLILFILVVTYKDIVRLIAG